MIILGEDGLFEGDMKLTEKQLLSLKWGALETHGDLGRVTYFPAFFIQKIQLKSKQLKHLGKCQQAITESSKWNHWEQLPLAQQHCQVRFNCHTHQLSINFSIQFIWQGLC